MTELDEIMHAIKRRLIGPTKRTDEETLKRLYPPTTAEIIQTEEEKLGWALPPLLRRLYLEVANGGFGPGYGLAGVAGCGPCEGQGDIIALYEEQSSPEWKARFPEWPPHLVRIAYLGCEMYAVADFSTTACEMFLFDAVLQDVEIEGEADLYFRNCLIPYEVSLHEWLHFWAHGKDVQMPPGMNLDSYAGISWDVVLHQHPPGSDKLSWRSARDFVPPPIGTRTEIIQKILEVVPFAQFPDSTEGIIDGMDFSVRISLGQDEDLHHIMLYVQGGEAGAAVIADMMRHLKLQAFEVSGAKTLKPERAVARYRKWRTDHDG